METGIKTKGIQKQKTVELTKETKSVILSATARQRDVHNVENSNNNN